MDGHGLAGGADPDLGLSDGSGLRQRAPHGAHPARGPAGPVAPIRRSDDEYYLTYKSKGLMVREEYNLPLTKESYLHLREKADGVLISKTRYLLPLTGTDLTIELDVFDAPYEGLYLAEVEFPDEASANAFVPPVWFGKDVTYSSDYHNSTLSKGKKL